MFNRKYGARKNGALGGRHVPGSGESRLRFKKEKPLCFHAGFFKG